MFLCSRKIKFIIDNYNIRLQLPNNSQLVQQIEPEDNAFKNSSTAGRHNHNPQENTIQIDDNHREKEPWSYLELNQDGMFYKFAFIRHLTRFIHSI